MPDTATILSEIATALGLKVEDFRASHPSVARLFERTALLKAFDQIDDPFTRAEIVRYVEVAAPAGALNRQNDGPL